MKTTTALLGLSLAFSPALYAQEKLTISNFALEPLSVWSKKSFSGNTNYSLITLDNKATLKAVSYSSASGLAKELKVDLKQMPYINWSWRIENRLSGLQETSKDGDDYAARIYVVKDGGWRIWRTQALNYVWSSNQEANSEWGNAYAFDNAKMIAVRGKNSNIGTWYTEKRNVYQDMIAQFGDQGSARKNEKAYRYIDVVALMTDTDNSQLNATAYYRDIYFSAD
jgi:hypothetical protein